MHDIDKFIAECCEVVAQAKVSKATLLVAYRKWAVQSGLQPALATELYRTVCSLPTVGQSWRDFIGIKLKP